MNRRDRLVRFASIALIGAFLVVVAFEIVAIWIPAIGRGEAPPGMDLGFYTERTQSWLDGTGFYRDRQLHGPYRIENGDALYPPPAILLFLPWALGAPEALWWLIPLGIATAALWRLRPPLWALAILAGVFVHGRMLIAIILGNPSIWAFAAILGGAAWGWPALVALTKPVLAPFALIGATRRSWWIGLAVVAVGSLAFAPMWPDYIRVLVDARNERDIWYVIGEVPIAISLAIVGSAGRANVKGVGPIRSRPGPPPLQPGPSER